jgi:hypothetical protein
MKKSKDKTRSSQVKYKFQMLLVSYTGVSRFGNICSFLQDTCMVFNIIVRGGDTREETH